MLRHIMVTLPAVQAGKACGSAVFHYPEHSARPPTGKEIGKSGSGDSRCISQMHPLRSLVSPSQSVAKQGADLLEGLGKAGAAQPARPAGRQVHVDEPPAARQLQRRVHLHSVQ